MTSSAFAPPAHQPTVTRPAHLSLVNRPGIVTVRIAGADPITHIGLLGQLHSRPDVQVVTNGEAQVVLALTDGIDPRCLRWVREASVRHRVVLVAGRADEAGIDTALLAGACSVVPRSEATPERLAYALRTALRERAAPSGRRPAAVAAISERERQVLTLVADGRSTREVAESLCYSERTIKNILQDLTVRLQLRNRTQAVAHAVRHGWI